MGGELVQGNIPLARCVRAGAVVKYETVAADENAALGEADLLADLVHLVPAGAAEGERS